MNSEMIIPKKNTKTITNLNQYSTMKNLTILTLLAAFLISCSGKDAAAPAQQAPTLPVLSITGQNASTQTEFPVAIQGKTDVEIRPQVDGTLDKIFVDEGAYVTQGQPLFKINDNPYRQQYNNAKASLNVARANVAQTRAIVANAEINLGYTVIKAPVSGYIGRLPRKQGSLISPADPMALTTLSDIKEVYAYFSLGENDFINFKSQYDGNTISDKLKKLPPVSLVLSDNTVYNQNGKVDMVDGQFDKTTGAITLRAKFPNAAGLLRSGNTGKVRISIEHSNTIVIPQEATIEIQDKV